MKKQEKTTNPSTLSGKGVGDMLPCLSVVPERIFLSNIHADNWDFLQLLNSGHPGSIVSPTGCGALEAVRRITALDTPEIPVPTTIKQEVRRG